MRSTFFCIDGHTAGNPVRLVASCALACPGIWRGYRRAGCLPEIEGTADITGRHGFILEKNDPLDEGFPVRQLI